MAIRWHQSGRAGGFQARQAASAGTPRRRVPLGRETGWCRAHGRGVWQEMGAFNEKNCGVASTTPELGSSRRLGAGLLTAVGAMMFVGGVLGVVGVIDAGSEVGRSGHPL